MTERYYAAFDPGFTGAIAVLNQDCEIMALHDMPVIETIKGKTKKGKPKKVHELDGPGVRDILTDFPLSHVFIEKCQTMPGQGIVSMGRYMESYGVLKGVCVGLGLGYTLVQPRTWKKAAMPDMGKDKGQSIVRVKQIYPDIKFPLVKDHGKADAVLIARYGIQELI